MRFEKLENDLTNLLLHNIVVYINPDKPIKKGKLKLFSVKEFYYILTLENDKNELKDYELFFVGDKCDRGGNDYELFMHASNINENNAFKTTGPENTLRIIDILLQG